jgi:3-hydroxyacyl-CoA dehydrogenase
VGSGGEAAGRARALEGVRVVETLEEAVRGVEYVQECGPEVLEVKRETFARLDAAAARETILASSPPRSSPRNSPSARRRARCIVAHPVNPPHLVPVVEVCGAPWTSAETKRRTIEIQRSVGQVPIDVKSEIDGFILNRLQVAFLTEAFRLVQEGYVSPEDLDHTVADGLGCAGPSWARSRRSSSTRPAASPTTASATSAGSAATWRHARRPSGDGTDAVWRSR